MINEKPTSLHSWPFEYDPTSLEANESHVIPKKKGREEIKMKEKEEKIKFSSGTTSSKQPRLSLIPHHGLVNAAIRFELGLERHGAGAYNALSDNTDPLYDKEWLIERCSHAIEHCYRLIDQLKLGDVIDSSDAGAVAWCGLVLGEAAHMNYYHSKTETKDIDSPDLKWSSKA